MPAHQQLKGSSNVIGNVARAWLEHLCKVFKRETAPLHLKRKSCPIEQQWTVSGTCSWHHVIWECLVPHVRCSVAAPRYATTGLENDMHKDTIQMLGLTCKKIQNKKVDRANWALGRQQNHVKETASPPLKKKPNTAKSPAHLG